MTAQAVSEGVASTSRPTPPPPTTILVGNGHVLLDDFKIVLVLQGSFLSSHVCGFGVEKERRNLPV